MPRWLQWTVVAFLILLLISILDPLASFFVKILFSMPAYALKFISKKWQLIEVDPISLLLFISVLTATLIFAIAWTGVLLKIRAATATKIFMAVLLVSCCGIASLAVFHQSLWMSSQGELTESRRNVSRARALSACYHFNHQIDQGTPLHDAFRELCRREPRVHFKLINPGLIEYKDLKEKWSSKYHLEKKQ